MELENFFTPMELAKELHFPSVHPLFWEQAKYAFKGHLDYEYHREYAKSEGRTFTHKDWCKRFKKEYVNNGNLLYQAYEQISIQNETINKDEELYAQMKKRIKELEEMCERYSKIIDLISDNKDVLSKQDVSAQL